MHFAHKNIKIIGTPNIFKQIKRKMKGVAIFCVILCATFAFVKSQDDEMREEYCKDKQPGICVGMKCNKENTEFISVGCSLTQCPNGEMGYEEDPSKPFPFCCPKPICK